MRRILLVACAVAAVCLASAVPVHAAGSTASRSRDHVTGPAALRALRVGTGRAAVLAAGKGAPASVVRQIVDAGRDAHLTATGLTWFWGGARRGVPDAMSSPTDDTALTIGERTLSVGIASGPGRTRVFSKTALGDGGFSVTANHVQLWREGGERVVYVPIERPGGRTWYAGTRPGFPGALTRVERFTPGGRLVLVTDAPHELERLSPIFWAY